MRAPYRNLSLMTIMDSHVELVPLRLAGQHLWQCKSNRTGTIPGKTRR